MANDSTTLNQVGSDQDTTPTNDSYFADMSGGEDAFFGPEQLAQAGPVQVNVPKDQNVIRVQVNPGEILELASPFDPGAALLAKEDNGNLAIKVGDVTVILQGYVAANEQAPVLVQTSDGKPLDIAVLLASTDPNIDIQTAAGPGEGAQGQGADNTGALLTQLGGPAGLGGFNAIGAQDQTELNYGNIDNGIRRELHDDVTPGASAGFSGLSEPFLLDPANSDHFDNYDQFISDYKDQLNNNPGYAWADFYGTKSDFGADFDAYMEHTSVIKTVDAPAGSGNMHLSGIDLTGMTSDGQPLYVDGTNSDGDQTLFIRRGLGGPDDPLVMVIHVLDHNPGEDFQIQTILVNRLDHVSQGNDVLDFEINFFITNQLPPINSGITEEQPPSEGTEGSVTVGILDDIPVAHQICYVNFLHGSSGDDTTPLAVGGGNTEITHDFGHVDEDWLQQGNHDEDNKNGQPDKDAARGDDIGDTCVVGYLNIEYGADGPAGYDFCDWGGHDGGEGLVPVGLTVSDQALYLNTGLKDGDTWPDVTSGGEQLTVLESDNGHILVGIVPVVETEKLFPEGGEGGCEPKSIPIFELWLNTNPNDPGFQQFLFELYGPLDQSKAGTPESNLLLLFPVVATDDDGDTLDTAIKIKVNDDAPKAVKDEEDVVSYESTGSAFAETVAAISYGGVKGNVLLNDMLGADTPTVVTAIAGNGHTDTTVEQGTFTIAGKFGTLTMFENGEYYYTVDKTGSGDDTFTYTITDKDGDTSTAQLIMHVEVLTPRLDSADALAASVTAETSYDVQKSVSYDYDASAQQFSNASYHVTDNGGSHTISGSDAGDKLEGNAGDDTLNGRGGDDLLFGGGNADDLHGGNGDDTLDGGDGADKMSGGRGDDTFLNIDVADLDGTNTIDGQHSIDGGKGFDTLDLSHLTTFDSSQAARVENVEVLDFTGGGATAVSLDYGAAYGITQVGGLHAFSIKGDSSDSVTLTPSDGQSWTQTGTDVVGSDGGLYNVYEAGAGATKVTVSVEHTVHVEAS